MAEPDDAGRPSHATEMPPVVRGPALLERRVLLVSALAVVVGFLATAVALLLTRLIGLVTNLAFYGRVSADFVSPAGTRLGLWVVLVPVVGGLVVGGDRAAGERCGQQHQTLETGSGGARKASTRPSAKSAAVKPAAQGKTRRATARNTVGLARLNIGRL